MTSLMRRERPVVAELFDWLDGEFQSVFRPFSGHPLRVEDYAEDGQYVVRAEVPGVDPDKDVAITIDDGVLTIKAERRVESSQETRSEFRYGAFARSVTLPAAVDKDDVKATYKGGILEIRFGLKADEKPETKQIPVTTG